MFVIYQNATKGDDPVNKYFMFDKATIVRYRNESKNIDAGKGLSIKVKKGGLVYATSHPVKLYTVEGE